MYCRSFNIFFTFFFSTSKALTNTQAMQRLFFSIHDVLDLPIFILRTLLASLELKWTQPS